MISFWVRRLPDSSTLITSLADGGRRSRFELCGSNSASAKTIPHFSSHRSQLLIKGLFIPFYWSNSPGRAQPRLWKLARPGLRPGSKRLCTSLSPIRPSIRRCYPRAIRAIEVLCGWWWIGECWRAFEQHGSPCPANEMGICIFLVELWSILGWMTRSRWKHEAQSQCRE